MYEVVPCQSDCSQYVWVAEPWSMWKVSNVDLKENCGEGVQTRKVRCVFILIAIVVWPNTVTRNWRGVTERIQQYTSWKHIYHILYKAANPSYVLLFLNDSTTNMREKDQITHVKSHRCMLNTIDGPSESVEDYLCDPEEMPLGARESRLPCPEDCVLSDWGAWSHCSLVRHEPRSESSSSNARLNIQKHPFAVKPTETYVSCQKCFLSCWTNSKQNYTSTAASCVWICQVFFIHQGGMKEICKLGCSWKIAYTVPHMHCANRVFCRKMIYD